MKQVAKVLIRNSEDMLLLLQLNNHPTFGNDPDLPGGTADPGETPQDAAIREVCEEAGITLDASKVELLVKDTTTSRHGTQYYVYGVRLNDTPDVTLSWEHQSYTWASDKEVIAAGRKARDTYMHVAAKVLDHQASIQNDVRYKKG